MRIRFAGFAHTRTYEAQGHEPWSPGDVREVPDGEAARLLAEYPSAFARAEEAPPVVAEAIDHAPVDRAMPEPKRPRRRG